jgi:hypothetical protein
VKADVSADRRPVRSRVQNTEVVVEPAFPVRLPKGPAAAPAKRARAAWSSADWRWLITPRSRRASRSRDTSRGVSRRGQRTADEPAAVRGSPRQSLPSSKSRLSNPGPVRLVAPPCSRSARCRRTSQAGGTIDAPLDGVCCIERSQVIFAGRFAVGTAPRRAEARTTRPFNTGWRHSAGLPAVRAPVKIASHRSMQQPPHPYCVSSGTIMLYHQ